MTDAGKPSDGAALLVEPTVTGWRAQVRARADGLRRFAGDRNAVAVREAYGSVWQASQPRRDALDRSGGWASRFGRHVGDWLTAGEAQRYEAAFAALLALRREVLLGVEPSLTAAYVPELREEVKRLVATSEPAFDTYLRLLDRIERTHTPAQGERPTERARQARSAKAVPEQRARRATDAPEP